MLRLCCACASAWMATFSTQGPTTRPSGAFAFRLRQSELCIHAEQMPCSAHLKGGEACCRVWSTKDGRLQRTVKAHRSGVRALAVWPSGHRLYSAGSDNTVLVRTASCRAACASDNACMRLIALSVQPGVLQSSLRSRRCGTLCGGPACAHCTAASRTPAGRCAWPSRPTAPCWLAAPAAPSAAPASRRVTRGPDMASLEGPMWRAIPFHRS